MDRDLEKYNELQRESSMLDDLCSSFWQVNYSVEKIKNDLSKRELFNDLMADEIISKTLAAMDALETRLKSKETEIDSLAAKLLEKNHKVKVGDKIPYHTGTSEKGFLRAERVVLSTADPDKSFFTVYGSVFKKDGTPGKRSNFSFFDFTVSE